MSVLTQADSLLEADDTSQLRECLTRIVENLITEEKELTKSLPIDTLANSLKPEECQTLDALKTTGNGNCLYNAASIALRGDETLSEKLRAATAIELYLNADKYANHNIFSETKHHEDAKLQSESYKILSLPEQESKLYSVNKNFQMAIKFLAKRTVQSESWSCLMHILALSSVLDRGIMSVYPMCNEALRPLLHHHIQPLHGSSKKKTIHIMWSREGNLDNRKGAVFEPNHFVPLINTHGASQNIEDDDVDDILMSLDEQLMIGSSQDVLQIQKNSAGDYSTSDELPLQTIKDSIQKEKAVQHQKKNERSKGRVKRIMAVLKSLRRKYRKQNLKKSRKCFLQYKDQYTDGFSTSDEIPLCKLKPNQGTKQKRKTLDASVYTDEVPVTKKCKTHADTKPREAEAGETIPDQSKTGKQLLNDDIRQQIGMEGLQESRQKEHKVALGDITQSTNGDYDNNKDDELANKSALPSSETKMKKERRKRTAPADKDEHTYKSEEGDADESGHESDTDIDFASTSGSSSSSDEEYDNEDDGSITWLNRLQKINHRPFAGPAPGPTRRLSSKSIELDYFYEIFPETMFDTMSKSTNAYVPIYENARRRQDPAWSDATYKPVTPQVIKAYIGVRMIMALDPKPGIEDYWTSLSLRNEYIANTMSRDRFKSIQRYFHVNDPSKDPTRLDKKESEKLLQKDPLYKVSPLMEKVRKNSTARYNLHQPVSVDEAMIKCHGQHWGIVGAPNKPAKRGFKVFVLADAVTGYLADFMVYLRKQKEVGLTKRVVENLTENIDGRNHVVFVDKFYTSVPLALSLLERNTYLCGSFNTGRKMWPSDLKVSKTKAKKNDPIKSMKRGQFLSRQSRDGRMVATVWKDKRHVYNLNTFYNPLTDARHDTVLRKATNDEGKWEKTEYPCPKSIVEFNKYMGGVDRHDHLRSSYTLQRTSTRWWTYFCWFAFDMAVINSFILFKASYPKATHKKFRLKLAQQLIAGYSDRVRLARQIDQDVLDQSASGAHESVKMKGRARACRFCTKMKAKTPRGRAKETIYGCAQCAVNIHRECFADFHSSKQKGSVCFDQATQTGDVYLTPTKERTVTSETDAAANTGRRTVRKACRKELLSYKGTRSAERKLRRSPRKKQK